MRGQPYETLNIHLEDIGGGMSMLTVDGSMDDAEADVFDFHIDPEGCVQIDMEHFDWVTLDGDCLAALLKLSDRVRKANEYLDARTDRVALVA